MSHIFLVALKGQIMTFNAHSALLWYYRRWDIFFVHMFIFSLDQNNIGDAGAQALAEGLKHCTNLQKLS